MRPVLLLMEEFKKQAQQIEQFKRQHHKVFEQYEALNEKLDSLRQQIRSLLESMELEPGQEVDFKNGWRVRRDRQRVVNVAMLLRCAKKFIQAHIDILRVNVTDLEKLINKEANGVIFTKAMFDQCIEYKPGSLRITEPKV